VEGGRAPTAALRDSSASLALFDDAVPRVCDQDAFVIGKLVAVTHEVAPVVGADRTVLARRYMYRRCAAVRAALAAQGEDPACVVAKPALVSAAGGLLVGEDSQCPLECRSDQDLDHGETNPPRPRSLATLGMTLLTISAISAAFVVA